MNHNRDLTPREIFMLKQERISRLDADGQADLFAEDGVLEVPFSPNGLPRRFEGRETIRAVISAALQNATRGTRRLLDHLDETVYETDDPEVVIAEFTSRTEDTVTGEHFQARYIQVLRIRDGQIVLFRDYCTLEAITHLWGDHGGESFAELGQTFPEA
ncbi:nuclear transport factor 2 family protein [Streptomyces sp. NBC_01288]|uniref:nuclear transport factor 2 family protein n=1 Tax=Streptomyces sp. NBC_01288 TaxID=2903814 RepID=UPI002E0F3019|nr:nuclear transport factor 2 family protein [Streptomyces sp. NBC_01288]